MKNKDELYICNLANLLPGVSARLATKEEDCGYQKADVVLSYNKKEYYIQVSHTPKSKREINNLKRRGTYNLSTYKFQEIPLSDEEIIKNIESILKN